MRPCQVVHEIDTIIRAEVAEEDRMSVFTMLLRGYRPDTGERVVRPLAVEENICATCRARFGDCEKE